MRVLKFIVGMLIAAVSAFFFMIAYFETDAIILVPLVVLSGIIFLYLGGRLNNFFD